MKAVESDIFDFLEDHDTETQALAYSRWVESRREKSLVPQLTFLRCMPLEKAVPLLRKLPKEVVASVFSKETIEKEPPPYHDPDYYIREISKELASILETCEEEKQKPDNRANVSLLLAHLDHDQLVSIFGSEAAEEHKCTLDDIAFLTEKEIHELADECGTRLLVAFAKRPEIIDRLKTVLVDEWQELAGNADFFSEGDYPITEAAEAEIYVGGKIREILVKRYA